MNKMITVTATLTLTYDAADGLVTTEADAIADMQEYIIDGVTPMNFDIVAVTTDA